ncbi:MAG: competence/damage-inducible protein A [Vicinamibacterales bacterium]
MPASDDLHLPPLSTAAIVAVGSELLTPFRSDSNSLAITARLEAAGIRLRYKAVAGDNIADITRAIGDGAARADLVIICGGLGPTADDLTRDAIAAFAGVELLEDPAIIAWLEARFAARGVPMPAINRRQAMLPEGARPLANDQGSAPGLLLERRDVTIAALPGPPRELLPMLDALMIGTLTVRSPGTPLARRVLKVSGRGESAVDEVAAPIYLPFDTATPPIETTILASPGLVELHLSCRLADREAADRALAALAARLEAALAPACFTSRGDSLEDVVGALLAGRGLWIAAAESCTAGMVAARLTDVAGSSAYVRGGIVAYDDGVKVSVLDVPAALIERHGAVSEPVARAMADGARARLAADVAVAVTGIAGPSGGSDAKPVGTVVIAATGLGRERVRTFRFIGDRALVRAQSVQAALEAVRRLILDL